ncbi:MAG TPA: MarR family winged helix-turn-helix transcriptional regulator [Actinomycetota bacterium]|nr:MarR family winged helix-turn-helix transcriptional regulator [Actinomycetota bacterium]
MAIENKNDPDRLLERVIAKELPGKRGLGAWMLFLEAHASLMRQLESELEQETGLPLADFDVLAQLARAGGELRMSDLANRALISRSGMTRRVSRLVDEGMVSRGRTEQDARGVCVVLTEKGLARLEETAPVHLRGIAQFFTGRLNDKELAVLERALSKLKLDCGFG